MIRMYMQLFLTLGCFLGFVLSSLWLLMTYLYVNSILEERGTVPVYNWLLINSVILLAVLSVAGFTYGCMWVRKTKAEEREKFNRYRRASAGIKKEAEASS